VRNGRACLVVMSLAIAPLSAVAAPNEDGEEIPPQEPMAIEEVKELIRKQVQADAAKEGHAFRDAHRKHHGCVRAKFVVKEGLAPQLRQGLFERPETYSAIVRYSNGSGRVEDDHDGDGRGMAVKLLGVTGERNISDVDDEATSQDFVMVNHPVFFVRNAEKYVGFQKALQSNVFLWVFNPVRFFHEGLIGLSILTTKMTNPLDATCFSMVPSKLGTMQMKFRATPCPGSQFQSASDSRDRLRENLAASLSASPACFQFQVQRRTQPDKMPIEDPTIEWKESIAPFETVAEITIPAQKPELGEACEAISYNPWNGLREHRPLGGISRTRKEVYQTISRIRHELNNQKRQEPAF
jgi:hypothetical protein